MANEAVEEPQLAQEGGEDEIEENGDINISDNPQEDINLSSLAPQTSGELSSPTAGPSDDAAGDYDPASVDLASILQEEEQEGDSRQTSLKPTPEPTAESAPAPKRRKTAGGFLVGDSDSEDDQVPTPVSNAVPSQPTQAPQSFPQSPRRTSISAPQPEEAVSTVPSSSQANNAPAILDAVPAEPSADVPPPFADSADAPYDVITALEQRIKQEPRAATDAWLDLIAELRRRNDTDALRDVYERFLAVFPQSADIWTAYMEMEMDINNFSKAEDLFKKTLTTIPNVGLLTVYLDYIRRRNDLSDPTGRARDVVAQSFEFVLSNDVVGVDRDSGPIWVEYIQFIKTGPGIVGEQDWESKKKMDLLRRVYQRAIAVPTKNLNNLWREYEQFENSIDKKLGRALVSQHSPSYMSAKSANMALDNMTRRLQRTNIPRLPAAPGFDGDVEYAEQVELWMKWINWEKSDPLELKEDEPQTLRSRILYVYRQALMALRFWPDMWVDAAEWCWENEVLGKGGNDQGSEILHNGIEANPESVLLALKHADRVEETYPVGEGDEAKVERGNAVKAPYLKLLDILYALSKSLKDEEKEMIDTINQRGIFDSTQGNNPYDDDDADERGDRLATDTGNEAQIKAIQQGYSARNNVLSKTISYVWIALARAMRRVQGKGVVGQPVGGMRQVFVDARARGKLASDVYVAIALMEWKVYKEKAGVKIFERGSKLFPEDEFFIVEYIKFLHSTDDHTNARVVFENCIKRLTDKPGSVHKARSLFAYFHKYESQYGDRSQIVKLEQRMAELFPDDPKLNHFAGRFSSERFNPIAARIIVSPTQMRPRNTIMPSIEHRDLVVNSPRPSLRQQNSPRPQYMPSTNSPKRPLPAEDYDESLNPPRKLQRGESPLKGAAGRRLDQSRRVQAAPIARDITFLLGLLPSSSSYNLPRFSGNELVRLVRNTHIPEAKDWKGPDRNGRGDNGRLQHNRQFSDNPSYQYPGRDSPSTGRPQSPFDMSRGRIASAASTYQQSSLRPGSSGSYEPPAAFSHAAPPPMQYPPPVMPTPDGSMAWPPPPQQMYNAPPPGGYAVPNPYGQAPPPPQPPYSGYY
ncbi:unnamed protein product [Discula destructiva]